MLRAALLFLCVVACRGHAILPLVPAVHPAPLAAPYAVHDYAGHGYAGHGYDGHGYDGHGYAGNGYAGLGYAGHGYAGSGYAGHGLLQAPGWAAPVHHVLKRSPIFVPLDGAPLAGHLGAIAPAEHIAPVAVSHQSRVDVRTSPAVVAAPVLPVVKTLAVPLLHKSFLAAPYHYGIGYNAAPYYRQ